MAWQSDALRTALAQAASISILVFAVSSMLSVGLAYRIGRILDPPRTSAPFSVLWSQISCWSRCWPSGSSR